MLEFVASRDIQPGEEVFIDYGEEWQNAWDEHVKKWEPISKESDLTRWTEKRDTPSGDPVTVYELNKKYVPVRTWAEQQANPYPHSLQYSAMSMILHISSLQLRHMCIDNHLMTTRT